MFLFTFIITGCSFDKSNDGQHTVTSASWFSSNLIDIDGNKYIGSNERVHHIGRKIGVIQTFSTDERDFNNDSFSNTYPKGTNLYEMKGIDRSQAIAVEIEKNKFIKANREN